MARQRRLPPLPASFGGDDSSREVVYVLITAYAEELLAIGDFDLETEAAQFLDLLEQNYPAAHKDFQTHHLLMAVVMMLRTDLIHHRTQAKHKARAERNRQRMAEASGRPASKEELPSMFDAVLGTGEGRYRSVAKMTYAELGRIESRYRKSADSHLRSADFCDRLRSRMSQDTDRVQDFWTKQEVEALADSIFDTP